MPCMLSATGSSVRILRLRLGPCIMVQDPSGKLLEEMIKDAQVRFDACTLSA